MSHEALSDSNVDHLALLALARAQVDTLRDCISRLSDLAWRPGKSTTHTPELRLALGRTMDGLDLAIRLLLKADDRSLGAVEATAYGRLEELLRVKVDTLKLETAWDYATALQCELVSLFDSNEMGSRIDDELAAVDDIDQLKQHNRVHHAKLSALRDKGRTALLSVDELAAAASLLAHLYAAQRDEARLMRASADAKALYFWPMIIALSLVLVGAIVVASVAEPNLRPFLLLSGFTGALGSTVSGILKLRDRIDRIADMRGLQSQILAQALVGAGAGVVTSLLLQSGILVIGSAVADLTLAGSGLLAFIAGFSEPFFLGVIGRVAGIGGDRATRSATPRPST